MKLLLDENIPKRLKQDFREHQIFTVAEKGWAGISNDALLTLLVAENFDALLTFDKNLQYQQNFAKYTITVLVLNAEDNSYETLKNLVEKIKAALSSSLSSGVIEIKI